MVRGLGISNLKPPPPPPQEHLPRWRRVMEGVRHSMSRDAEAIHHHYDVSNAFYEHVLGPSMAYTCAVYPTETATLEEAQAEKFDLVARKLALEAGPAAARRRLRLGRHGAARRQGVRREGARRDAEPGAGLVGEGARSTATASATSPRCGTSTTATCSRPTSTQSSSIGLTEHIGIRNYPAYFGFLRDRLQSRGPVCSTTHHPPPQPTPTHRCVHRPIRVPRRRAHRQRHDHHRGAERRSRGHARGEPRSTTPRPWRPGTRTWWPTGTPASRRSASAPPGCGASTWPAAGSASSATRCSCTRCSPSAPPPTAADGFPLRPSW